jgi:competence protein ComFC
LPHWKAILNSVDNLFFPPVCLACSERIERVKDVLCSSCRELLSPITENYCDKCGAPMIDFTCPYCAERDFVFDIARAAFIYRNPVQELIHIFKYDAFLAPADFLSQALLEIPDAQKIAHNFDCITSVPLHPVRYRERGYNQSELIARKLAIKWNLPYIEPVKRHLPTESQTTLNIEERINNLKNAFSLKKNINIAGKRVILVDDVFTTGTTVNEVSRILKKGGASKVAVLTAARAI